MITTLTFDSSIPEDIEALAQAIAAKSMAIILWELQHNSYRQADQLAEEKGTDAIDEHIKIFAKLLEEHPIVIENLIH